MLKPWLALTYKTIQLGLDAQNVVALRLTRLAAGGARGQNEVRRMVTEKIAAGVEAQAIVGLGIITATRTRLLPTKSSEFCGNESGRTNADCIVSDAFLWDRLLWRWWTPTRQGGNVWKNATTYMWTAP